MHYTSDHTMDVTPAGIFRRLVRERGGSCCFGLNGMFLQILRGLGYRAYAGSARVNRAPNFAAPPDFGAFSHMIIFVQPFEGTNRTYVVDVGFGANGLTRPILLSDAEDNVVFGITPTERHRLRLGSHPLSSLENPRKSISHVLSWQLEVWQDNQNPVVPNAWKILYTLRENEFLDVDIQNASFISATKPEGILWNNVFCMRHFLIQDMKQKPEEAVYTHSGIHDDGKFMYRLIMIGDEVTERVGTHITTVRTLKSEQDRTAVMRELFGIPIEDSAAAHIEGRAPSFGAALKNK